MGGTCHPDVYRTEYDPMLIMFTLTPEERQLVWMKESDPSVEKSKVSICEVLLNTGYDVILQT